MRSEARVEIVAGMTGRGKTSLVRALIGGRRRVLILEAGDWNDEYPGAIRFHTWAQLVAMFKRLPKGAPFLVSFAPGSRYFRACCALAWVLGDVTLVIEEMGKYVGPGQPEPRELIELYERGRHRGVRMVSVTQRPKRQPIGLRAECGCCYVFQLAEQADREWVSNVPGGSKAIAERVKDLRPYEYLAIESGGTVRHEKTSP